MGQGSRIWLFAREIGRLLSVSRVQNLVEFMLAQGWCELHPNEIVPVHGLAVKQLAEKRIVTSARSGRVRVSPHFYNTEAEIDAFLDALP